MATAQQKPHSPNIGIEVPGSAGFGDLTPPAVAVPKEAEYAPVREIRSEDLVNLGARLNGLFDQYRADRRILELRLLRCQRQYLGIYDPEIEQALNPNRSKAYPKLTRVKCISVLSKLMNLMFPGNEKNWCIEAAPSPDISLEDVKEALTAANKRDQDAGIPVKPPDMQYTMDAVHQLMVDRAEKLTTVIDDQLQELGGDQHCDYIALNRQALESGIKYGLGLLRGPFARETKSVVWEESDKDPSVPYMPKVKKVFKPVFEFVPIWDFYPDLSAKSFHAMDGYFLRKVMSKHQILDLCKRPDFMHEQIINYLNMYPVGNYRALEFELELRVMGVRMNVNDQKPDTQKYEVKAWIGKLDGHMLQLCGAEVPEDKLAEQLNAEVWFIDGHVIKCTLDPWAKVWPEEVHTLHHFLYDHDDTSPVGFGLPYAIRDSQLMVAAATRMLLDNASIVCGPNLELNTKLLRADQDLSSIRSYRIWYRDDDDPATAQYPAVRNVEVDAHMKELMQIVELGMKFADMETFVGPANGGDQSQMPSEPYRTASGASMLRGETALPFKDMIRAFDSFTQSILTSIVIFNKVFNPSQVHDGDYNIIARGATSLIAKEVKGMNADQLVTTLTPEEKLHVDSRKLLSVRLKSRDMEDIMVSDAEAQRRQQAQDQDQDKQDQQQDKQAEALLRKTLAESYKNIATGQKNLSAADAQTIDAFLQVLERGLAINGTNTAAAQPAGPNSPGDQDSSPDQGPGPDGPAIPQLGGPPVPGGPGQAPQGQPNNLPSAAG